MKKVFEDMVPNNRKSIRDVQIPNRINSKKIPIPDRVDDTLTQKRSTPSSLASLYGGSETENGINHQQQPDLDNNWTDAFRTPGPASSQDTRGYEPVDLRGKYSNNTNRTPTSKLLKLLGILFVPLIIFFGIAGLLWTFVFPRLTIDITTHSEEVVLTNAQFTAQKASSSVGILYSVMTLSEEGFVKVAPSGERQIKRAASGKVTIYNAYSNKPQRLIRNTRLESTSGLIFRIVDSVTLPGKTVVNGEEKPGSITTTVEADTPGENYNISLSDFTIPGFKGDPKYTKFYARSVEPMRGGYIGTERVVSDDILRTTQSKVQSETIAKLTKEARSKLTDDQYIFDSGIYSETELLPPIQDGNMVAVKAKVTLYATVFSKSLLAKSIAEAHITPFDGSPLALSNPEELAFEILNKDQIRPWIDSSLTFTLTGKPKIIWVFDELKLKEALAGQPKSSFHVILTKFPSISKAVPHLSPVWQSSIPSNLKQIIIKK